MASANEEFTLGWSDYANNFSHSFSDLLEQKELVDVTLVADGYLLNAHRLVLSALSPYFHQMFTSMPANQQAFGTAIVYLPFTFKVKLHIFQCLFLACFVVPSFHERRVQTNTPKSPHVHLSW